ncbi:MAG: OB-fold domain-containing protein [Peptococcaceae bacterium]|nr:OB-fold domain-containing protein [Peptococcaceae bacterium]
MAGITSYGAYIPFNRLDRRRLQEAFGEPALPGEKAVANFDEDSVSMAASAALDCLAGADPGKVAAVYFATTTPPYREKQSATTIAAAVDARMDVRTADFTGSLRSGSAALLSGLDAVQAGAGPVLVAAADCRLGCAQGQFEQLAGDGAAAFLLGDENVIAELEASCSLSADIISVWRSADDRYVRSWEERFYITEGYQKAVYAAAKSVLKKAGLAAKDIARAVIYAPGPRYQAAVAAALGFAGEQVQDGLFGSVGSAGAAHAPMMLAAALEEARPGDRILFVTFGEGSDALIFRVTGAVADLPPRRGVKGHLGSKKVAINYQTYLKWRNMIPVEPPRRPDPDRPSVPAMWRGVRQNLSFYGSVCRRCGTPQYPRQRVCVSCQAKDEMDLYKFADRTGRIATYTIDYLTFSPDPPTVFAVVDFEGGGRMICEMTDCDPARIEIGMEVEMSFRRLFEAGGLHTYFWKARPKR